MKYGSMLQGINRKTEAKLLTKSNKNTMKSAKKCQTLEVIFDISWINCAAETTN
jgi:hypothetical protein